MDVEETMLKGSMQKFVNDGLELLKVVKVSEIESSEELRTEEKRIKQKLTRIDSPNILWSD